MILRIQKFLFNAVCVACVVGYVCWRALTCTIDSWEDIRHGRTPAFWGLRRREFPMLREMWRFMHLLMEILGWVVFIGAIAREVAKWL